MLLQKRKILKRSANNMSEVSVLNYLIRKEINEYLVGFEENKIQEISEKKGFNLIKLKM